MNDKLKSVIEKFDLLKIFSLFIAVILFLVVNPSFSNPIWNEFFQTTQTIDDVPLSVVYDTAKYDIDGLPPSIDVSVSGNSSQVRNVVNDSTKVLATIDLSKQQPGEFLKSSDLITFNVEGINFDVIQKDFKIIVQENITKEFSISTTYTNGDKLNDGIILDKPSLEKNTIKISGGNKKIDSIASVIGLIDLGLLEASGNTNESNIQMNLVAYDAEGNVIEDINMEQNSINVQQPYQLQTVKLPINYEYINNDTKLFVNKICPIDNVDCDSETTEYVDVYGDSQKIDEIDSITYQIDMSNVTTTGGQVSAKPILDSNVFVVGEGEKNYNISLEQGVTRNIEKVNLSIENLDPKFSAISESADDATVDVIIKGPESLVQSLTKDDISIYIDLKSFTKQGSYDVKLSIGYKNNIDITMKKDTVKIEIVEKEK